MASPGAATVEKALDVLFHLHDAGAALGLSEIGRALDLPKSSCHRLLVSLVNREMVERDDAGHYRPGLALLSLGIGAQSREPVVAAARRILEELAVVLGETVFVVGLRHGQLRVLDKVEGPGFLRAAPGVGDLIPDDVTAVGKLYRVFGEAGLSDVGHSSESLEIEERDVSRVGYATNRDAWIDGLSVLAVPIWQEGGRAPRRMVGALALASASARFDVLGEGAIADQLQDGAERVAASLGTNHRSARAARAGR